MNLLSKLTLCLIICCLPCAITYASNMDNPLALLSRELEKKKVAPTDKDVNDEVKKLFVQLFTANNIKKNVSFLLNEDRDVEILDRWIEIILKVSPNIVDQVITQLIESQSGLGLFAVLYVFSMPENFVYTTLAKLDRNFLAKNIEILSLKNNSRRISCRFIDAFLFFAMPDIAISPSTLSNMIAMFKQKLTAKDLSAVLDSSLINPDGPEKAMMLALQPRTLETFLNQMDAATKQAGVAKK